MIFCVGKTRNQHASGQGISAVRSDGAAGSLGKIVDRLSKLRLRRTGVHVEDENAAAFETREPELAPIIRESAVMRLVAALNGRAADDFAIGRRAWLYVHGDKFICTIAHTLDA